MEDEPALRIGSSTALTWIDFSVGIENLVANAILVPPVNGSAPILASWDRPFFKITNLNAYPTTYGPVNSDSIQMGWSLDYASSSPQTVLGLSNWNGSQSGYSTDGGATWTHFPSVPSNAIGGEIAATTPQNIIMAPTGSVPYRTTNQGASWTALSVPRISNWSTFHNSQGFKKRGITADRVLPNTFYLYYGGYGVFKSTDGGNTWANVYNGNNGYIDPANPQFAYYNAWLSSVPGNAGHLFYTGGWQLGASYPVNERFCRSTDGGATWTAVPNVMQVTCFGFGAPAPGQTYPRYISPALSTANTVSGNQPTMPKRGPRSEPIRAVSSCGWRPFLAIPTYSARSTSASMAVATPICREAGRSRHPYPWLLQV